jgi:hypothetical protein
MILNGTGAAEQGETSSGGIMSQLADFNWYNYEVTDNLDEFIFKLGIYIGLGKHTVLYSNRNLTFPSIVGNIKRVYVDSEESKESDATYLNNPKLGAITVLATKKVSSFKASTLVKLMDKHMQFNFPEYAKLDELSNTRELVDDV